MSRYQLPKLSLADKERLENIRLSDEKHLSTLQNIKPIIMDLTIREPSVGINLGHTVQNKLDLLSLTEPLNFSMTVLATFNYGIENEPQPDDLFCEALQSQNFDFSKYFAFSDIGKISNSDVIPSLPMNKVVKFGFHNIIFDVDLMEVIEQEEAFTSRLIESVKWFKKETSTEGSDSKVFVNFRDIPDVYAHSTGPEAIMKICKLCDTEGVDAILMEDPRGSFFPFQIASIVKLIRATFNPEKPILVHVHSGNGMENAIVIEALLAGASGTWAGFTKEAAVIGHASNMEFIANLARVGNQSIISSFPLHLLSDIAIQIRKINCEDSIPDNTPIFGKNAYSSMLSVFDQNEGKFMDLPATSTGQTKSYRVCPIGSDEPVILGRLAEIGIENVSLEIATKMRILMRQNLNMNIRKDYNLEKNLLALLDSASTMPSKI